MHISILLTKFTFYFYFLLFKFTFYFLLKLHQFEDIGTAGFLRARYKSCYSCAQCKGGAGDSTKCENTRVTGVPFVEAIRPDEISSGYNVCCLCLPRRPHLRPLDQGFLRCMS